MKYYIFSLLMFYSLIISAQIGIGTTTIPDGIVLNIGDKVFTSDVGNIGINTSNPTSKIHIVTGGTSDSPNTQFKIENGKQSLGKVLQSNSKGVGSWVDYTPDAALGIIYTSGVDIASTYESTFANTKSYITLQPGEWLVMYTIAFNTTYTGTTAALSRAYVNTSLSDGPNSSTISTDIIGTTVFANSIVLGQRGTISGRCIINNQGLVPKDYYIILGNILKGTNLTIDFTLTGIGSGVGNSLYAFRVK